MRAAAVMILFAVCSFALCSVPATPAQAQGAPSADDIICKLRPDGCPEIAGRGIRVNRETDSPTTTPSINLTVLFRTNSAELAPEAMLTLNALGTALSSPALSPFHFQVEGHTDTVGSRDANLTLSGRRAAAVADYLSARFAIGRERLLAVGLGQEALLVPTPPQTPEPRNRRVQVVNLGR